MMHPSTMKLVDRLCAMTAQGKIEWAHGESPDSLVYDTEGYSVILHGQPTNIRLTDSTGIELEKVTAADLSQTPHEEGTTYEAAVAGLLVDAQRIARGTETAINSVLQGLDLDGDGIVDIPMEDGLVPTAAEIADHEPDMGEDTANESGVASLADADVTDVSNAVASLADEVNQTTAQAGIAIGDGLEAETDPLREDVTAQREGDASPIATMTGFGIAGLGATGLLKAARQPEDGEPEPTPDAAPSETAPLEATRTVDIDDTIMPEITAMPEPAPLDEIIPPEIAETDFNLSAAEASEQPLQLEPDPSTADIAPNGSQADTNQSNGTFVPPQPGEVLSLSGLAKGNEQDKPLMAGTATTMAHANPTAPQMPEPMPPSSAGEDEATAPAEPEPDHFNAAAGTEGVETPANPYAEVETTAEPAPSVEPEAEPTSETLRPSRFNPWI